MATLNLGAAKRLRKELQNLERGKTAGSTGSSFGKSSGDDDDDVWLRPSDPDGLIRGPSGTPYEGGVFQLSIRVGTDYPLAPPTIEFVTKVFHPNVHFGTGEICLDILKKEWSPAWGLQAACRAVLALLSDPDADSPLNCDAGNMVRGGDMAAFQTTARMYTVENAMFVDWPEK